MFPLTSLKKTKAGRMQGVETYKTICKNQKNTIPTSWLKVSKSIKTPESPDMFGHVAIGKLENEQSVVVKVYERDDNMLDVELRVLRRLTKYNINNIVRLICHFPCSNENKLMWNENIRGERALCQGNGKNKLYFIVMEHIRYGNIGDYFSRHAISNSMLLSFVQQGVLCLLELHYRFKIHHGDLHYGNVLIDFDETKKNEYRIEGREFVVDTNGCEPIFIDFGRANKSSGQKSTSSSSEESNLLDSFKINWTLQEVLQLLSILQRNLKNDYQLAWLKKVYRKIQKFSNEESVKCADYIIDLKIKNQ